MTIQQMKCLCAVVKYGSFSIAAEELYLSQSTVSKHVMALEREVGFSLTERMGGKTVLTDHGKRIMVDIMDIITTYDRLQDVVTDIQISRQAQKSNAIQFCSVPIMDELGLMAKFNAFMEAGHPYRVALGVMDEIQILHTMEAQDYELAFCSDVALDARVFQCYPYKTFEFAIFVSHNHPLARYDTLELSQLEGHTLVMPAKESMLLSLCTQTCARSGFKPSISLTTNRPAIALAYIKNTEDVYMGVDMVMPNIDVSHYKKIKLCHGPSLQYVFAHRKDVPLSEGGQLFLRHMLKEQ